MSFHYSSYRMAGTTLSTASRNRDSLLEQAPDQVPLTRPEYDGVLI
jgi:hypothetical protein